MQPAQRSDIVAFLRDRIIHRIGIPAAELGDDMVLSDLGMKSLDVVLISGEIEDHFGIEVEPSMMFEYRTVNAVADRLAEIIPGP